MVLKKVKVEAAVSVTAAQAAAEQAQDRVLCAICFDAERGVLYMPCGHLAACAACDATLAAAAAAADRAAECPMCQTEVVSRVNGIVLP